MKLNSDVITRNFQNIGLHGATSFINRINQGLDEFDQYLRKSENNEQKKYVFSFTPYTIGELEQETEEKKPVNSGGLFWKDPLGEKPCLGIEKGTSDYEIIRKSDDIPGILYQQNGTLMTKYMVNMKKFILKDLQVEKDSLEIEEEAFEILKNERQIYTISRGKKRGNSIRIIENNALNGEIAVERLPDSNYFSIRTDTSNIKKQRKAIEMLKLGSSSHLRPLLRLFDSKEYAKWEPVVSRELSYYILTDPSISGVHEQREFVKKAVSTPDFAFLEGPPGSGKTTSILEVIAQYIADSKRVLLVASTHVAVDNVIERLVESKSDDISLMEKLGIVPVRIGLEENVSDKVSGYTMENRIETERKRIIHHLKKIYAQKKLLPAQQNLLSFLEESDMETVHEVLGKHILNSTNLVCGTTLGILQTPELKQLDEATPLFDLLILDEASKTTFQEFLVPAMYAKKWILSGDCRQLSPYVERDQIIRNLTQEENFPSDGGILEKTLARIVFLFIQHNAKEKHVVIKCNHASVHNEIHEYLKVQINEVKTLTNLTGFNIPEIITISSPVDLEKLENNNKPPFRLILSLSNCMKGLGIQETWLSNREPIYSNEKEGIAAYISDNKSSLGSKWEDEIFWRMERIHDLGTHPLSLRYSDEIQALIPHFTRDNKNGAENARKIRNSINKIQRVAFPSVLEIFQSGKISSKKPGVRNSAINLGLTYGEKNNKIFTSRHTLLTYQHRMHPDISLFPREFIYNGSALQDGNGIEKRRSWNNPFGYETRNTWIHVKASANEKGQDNIRFNRAEVNEMKLKLNQFISWAKNNKNPHHHEGIWTVALLSFYKGQTREIMSALNSLSGKSGYYQEFSVHDAPVKVTICTVDRFQGHEADLVMISFVRGKKDGYGFLDCKNRLNVALTRARYQQLLIGDRDHYSQSHDKILMELGKIDSAIKVREHL